MKSNRASDNDGNKNLKVVDRWTLKKSKARYIEPDDDEEAPHIDDGALDTHDTGKATVADGVPKSPSSMSPTEARHQTFLKSLSDDVYYQELLLLLLAAKVSNISSVFSLLNPWIGRWTLGGKFSNLGVHGNPLIATCPRTFSTQSLLSHSQLLQGGLRPTQLLLMMASLHHLIMSSLSL